MTAAGVLIIAFFIIGIVFMKIFKKNLDKQ